MARPVETTIRKQDAFRRFLEPSLSSDAGDQAAPKELCPTDKGTLGEDEAEAAPGLAQDHLAFLERKLRRHSTTSVAGSGASGR